VNDLVLDLKKKNLITIIDDEVDIYLEIAHIAYVKIKQENAKVLLFTNPVDKKNNVKFDTPVMINLFSSMEMIKEIFGDVDAICDEISALLKPSAPSGLIDKLSMFSYLFSLKSIFPKRLKNRGACQEIVYKDSNVDLFKLPILTTWEGDSAPFITMGQVYAQSLDGKRKNLGMYRLQVHSKNKLGLHFQIHKDSNSFLNEYKQHGIKMPISIAIGGDPLYTWCATAPLPPGIFELLLYGFIKKTPAKLVKCLTNDLYVPNDADFVIEGLVDIDRLLPEGPFGDHTGYYTPQEPYPLLDVTCITSKKNPIYLATVVGKPPLEDKYMGYPTERIFLPLLKMTAPHLIDYYMPENGVFHNLILASISPQYPSHAKQIMHSFWGIGQMSFVKHAIFVNEKAPKLQDTEAITEHILNRFSKKSMLISYGVCDALDHSSNIANEGGKLGIDVVDDVVLNFDFDLLQDKDLLEKMQKITKVVKSLKQYKTNTKNPICVISVDKNQNQKEIFDLLKPLVTNIRILVAVDNNCNNLNYPYMLLWRVVNNIDAQRDIVTYKDSVFIDGTNKNKLDGFNRVWPPDTNCTKEAIDSLSKRGLIDIDKNFIEQFGIY